MTNPANASVGYLESKTHYKKVLNWSVSQELLKTRDSCAGGGHHHLNRQPPRWGSRRLCRVSASPSSPHNCSDPPCSLGIVLAPLLSQCSCSVGAGPKGSANVCCQPQSGRAANSAQSEPLPHCVSSATRKAGLVVRARPSLASASRLSVGLAVLQKTSRSKHRGAAKCWMRTSTGRSQGKGGNHLSISLLAPGSPTRAMIKVVSTNFKVKSC